MQSNIVVGETEITGTLKYVTGYTGFDTVVSEQEGNYLALKFEVDPADAAVIVNLLGGTKGPVTLDSDMNMVLRIADKQSESIEVTVKKGDKQVVKTYGLTGLTLEPKA